MQGDATVFLIAEQQQARAESAAWARLAAAADGNEWCASWLALLAGRVDRARAALLLLISESAQGPAHVAYPNKVDGRLHGAVVIDVAGGGGDDQ